MMEALNLDRVTVGYGPGPPALRDVTSPPLAAGRITSLVGPNGAGKSTLLRALAGLLPARGSARLSGVDLLSASPATRARLVAYMPQSSAVRSGFSVLESLIAALEADGLATGDAARRQAAATLDRIGILHLANRPLHRLSGGQQQLASLAAAIVRRPKLLLLDEPTSALDLNFQLHVMELVGAVAAEGGAVAVAVLHDLGLASRWSDMVLLLRSGALAAAGPPDQVVTSNNLRDVYGVDADVDRDPSGFVRITVRGRSAGVELNGAGALP